MSGNQARRAQRRKLDRMLNPGNTGVGVGANREQRRGQERRARRYVLACAICGREFSEGDESMTLGEVEHSHFMRMHDTAKIRFVLLDRWHDRREVREVKPN